MAAARTESSIKTPVRPGQQAAPKAPPGPRGHRLAGSLLEVRRDRLNFVTRATRNYGDIVGFRMGPKRLYLLGHPDHARHVLCENHQNYSKGLGLAEAKPLLGEGLLTSEGELWSSQRRLLQIAFQSGHLEQLSNAMVNAALSLVKRWETYAKRADYFDVSREMVHLTLSILDATLLRADLSAHVEQIGRDINLIAGWAMSRMAAVLKLPLQVPTPKNLKARKALARMELVVERAVRNRRLRQPDGEVDILSLLLSHSVQMGGHGSSDKQIRDEIMTFLVAGHETTASVLIWTWYLLSLHTEAEQRLHEELDSVIGSGPPSACDLPSLVYTRMIVEEAMRLYPPVWLIPRKAIIEDTIGGFRIPPRSDTLLSVYSIHRHPSFWERPDSFEPERFAPNKNSKRAPCSYLPFGSGSRSCIGSRFGLMEAMLVIAVVARRFHLRLLPSYIMEPDASLTLRPRQGLLMKVIERKQH